jgi:16S rRNA (cytidine1402-2'-O)-methyltransferase
LRDRLTGAESNIYSSVKAAKHNIRVTPFPGPSAVTTLLSICGFASNEFAFRGFYPRKAQEHEKEMARLRNQDLSSVFVYFESPLRVLVTLERIAISLPEAEIVVAKELTKLHEQIFRGTPLQG